MHLLQLIYQIWCSLTIWSYHRSVAPEKIPSHAYVRVETDPSGVIWPWRVFKSSPHTPPNMTISGEGGALAPGFFFMTPQTIDRSVSAAKQNGGFIMTADNEMVFALDIPGITDLRVQNYNGEPHITYWSGFNTDGANIGHGYGQVNFIDAAYNGVSFVPDLKLNKLVQTAVANWSIDLHEHEMTDQNTILITAYNNTAHDLSSLEGPEDGWIADTVIFEIDVKTWEILFSWKASEHVPLKESHLPIVNARSNGTKAAPWDWFHVNSIEKVGNDYLINGRHTWSVYLVSGSDGSVVWRFEGETGGDFGSLPSEGTFRWQHFARASNVTNTSLDLSIFDNHNAAVNMTTIGSTGLVYHLELPANRSVSPRLIRKIETPGEAHLADSQGSYEPSLSNGNQLVSYGQIAITREYGPATDGSDLRWQAQFGGYNTVQSYRAYKHVWHATPATWDPSLIVEDGLAYVSWNGATNVQRWNVYINGKREIQAVAEKKGFETVFKIPSAISSVQVGAVEDGTEVRRSNTVDIRSVHNTL